MTLMANRKGLKRRSVNTRRLVLRPYRLDDHKTWFDAYVKRLPKQSKYDRDPVPANMCSRREFSKLVRRHEVLAAQDRTYIYGIFERKTGVLVGAIDIHILVREDRQTANFGYQIHNRYWQKGFGKEAAKAGLKIAFSQLKLNRLEAAIYIENKPSIRLAKSIGMRRAGVEKAYLFENGAWVDQIVYIAIPQDIGLKAAPPKVL